MLNSAKCLPVAVAVSLSLSGPKHSLTQPDEFELSCASFHGVKGDNGGSAVNIRTVKYQDTQPVQQKTQPITMVGVSTLAELSKLFPDPANSNTLSLAAAERAWADEIINSLNFNRSNNRQPEVIHHKLADGGTVHIVVTSHGVTSPSRDLILSKLPEDGIILAEGGLKSLWDLPNRVIGAGDFALYQRGCRNLSDYCALLNAGWHGARGESVKEHAELLSIGNPPSPGDESTAVFRSIMQRLNLNLNDSKLSERILNEAPFEAISFYSLPPKLWFQYKEKALLPLTVQQQRSAYLAQLGMKIRPRGADITILCAPAHAAEVEAFIEYPSTDRVVGTLVANHAKLLSNLHFHAPIDNAWHNASLYKVGVLASKLAQELQLRD